MGLIEVVREEEIEEDIVNGMYMECHIIILNIILSKPCVLWQLTDS